MGYTSLKWQFQLLRLFCNQEYLEEFEGDLLERFEKYNQNHQPANWLLFLDVLQLIKPKLIRPLLENHRPSWHHMLKHNVKVSLRNIQRRKTSFLINYIGLVIGISSCFLLLKYIGFFLSMDDFQLNKDQIYAIHQTVISDEHTEEYSRSTYHAVAPSMKELYPEIQAASRYITTAETMVHITKDGQSLEYNENNISEVDADFLQMFTLNFIEGNETSLTEANTMVLSASLARKYFGGNDPIGQIITTTKTWGEERNWVVTGVFEDYPKNSSFEFNALQSLTGKEFEVDDQDWDYPFFKSFILLENAAIDGQALGQKMSSYFNQIEAFKADNREIDFHLIQLKDNVTLTDSQKLLIAVGFFLLLITIINYTNLAGAHSLTRGKEFGVRKVLGSTKMLLTKQFLVEGLVIYGLACLSSIVLILIFYPVLQLVTNERLLPIFEFSTPINVSFLILLSVGCGFSAVIPSFAISSASIENLVKDNAAKTVSINGFRKGLVLLQLVIALVMITGTITIYRQMQFIKTKDLGINTDQTLILNGPKDLWEGKLERLSSFKNEVSKSSYITNVSASTRVPFKGLGAPTIVKMENSPEEHMMFLIGTDGHYFEVYNINFLAGEAYRTAQYNRKRQLIVVNETASKKLGFSDPSQALYRKIINIKTNTVFEIVGVVEDYHHQSLKEKIEAQIFNLNPFRGFISLHLNLNENATQSNISNIIESIENTWNVVYQDQAFDYFFLDERLNLLYQEERFFQRMFLWFTTISVVVTFLGIYGLSMFISLQRKNEMGIRKVMGASPLIILKLFYSEFAKKVLMAILLASPLAYYLINLWLSNFVYRISFDVWAFVIPWITLSIFMLFSLGIEGGKMMRLNPLTIIKDE